MLVIIVLISYDHEQSRDEEDRILALFAPLILVFKDQLYFHPFVGLNI
jgi:hypothetical protein